MTNFFCHTYLERQGQQKEADQPQNNVRPSSNLLCPELPSSDTLSLEFFNPSCTVVDSETFCCGFYGSNALLDSVAFMNMDNISTPDLDSTSTSALLLQPRSEKDENSLNGFAQCESPDRSESVSGHGGESLGLGTDDLPCLSGKTGWLSPLHIAAQKGHDRIARVLLQHNIDCNEKDSDGLTPLIHAIAGGYEDVVCLLLSHGACIGSLDSQRRSALHWAVIHRRETMLKVLLNHCSGEQALIDGYDNDGRTPLHTAVDMGFETGVQILLQFGANVHSKARKS